MSLIALIANVIIVGDILITSSDEKIESVELPTILKKAEFRPDLNLDVNVINLKQKIYIINDRFAVALAGSVYEMRLFLGDIKNHFKYKETSADEIISFINNYDAGVISKISVGMVYYDGERFFNAQVGTDWKGSTNFIFGHLSAAGTGAQWFIDELSLSLEMEGNLQQFNISSQQLNLAQLKARVSIQNLIFLFKEKFYGSTVIDSWGGGFEIICFENGVFKKINDVLYLVINCSFDKDGALQYNSFFLMNYNYYDGVLLLTCTDTVIAKRYAVAPLDITQEDFDKINFPKEPVLESEHIIGLYSILMPNGSIAHRGFDYTIGTGQPDVEISILGDKRIQFAINQDFQNMLLGDIIAEAGK